MAEASAFPYAGENTMKKVWKTIAAVGIGLFTVWLFTAPFCTQKSRETDIPLLTLFTIEERGEGAVLSSSEVAEIQEDTNTNRSRKQKEQKEEIVGTIYIREQGFEVRNDVESHTLKESIGWLPGSALPPERGSCVLMGHRNTQFRILENIEIGEKLIFESKDMRYAYEVTGIQILENDSALRFYAADSSKLVLVTCYPFYYSGNAPQKYVVTAELS